ncbi:MAG: chemotaxis protein CheA [Clostridia bacterium]|nr:chemotaxis protein CheA [Clostridia bacterium]
MDMNQYIEIFTEEAKEHLQNLNSCLLSLEKKPSDVTPLDEIFRSAHTLKGMSATMGFEKMAELTHLMENVLSKLRAGEEKVTSYVMDILFQCLDVLEQMVHTIVFGTGDDLSIADLTISLKQIEEGKQNLPSVQQAREEIAATSACQVQGENETFYLQNCDEFEELVFNDYEKFLIISAIAKGYATFRLRINFDESCLMKVARAFMVFRNIEEVGEIIKSVPPVQEIEDEKFDNSFEIVLISKETEQKLRHVINSIAEVNLGYAKIISISNIQDISMNKAIGDVASEEKSTANNNNGKGLNRKSKAMQTVRVDIERLDNLMNLVGELVISKTRLEQISSASQLAELTETIEHIDLITSDLQAVVMKVRMVPLEQVFNRFPRMIRDLARDLNKKVNLVIKGEDTELDRTVIDEIGDPLVHLLRNSIDHGIESPEIRVNKGKSEEATLRLEAWYEGNNVVIEVEDDGQGIDVAVIKNKAIEKGVITKAEVEQMDELGIINLIFRSGFTTANKITDVSGRGVGLDAVRTKIDSLNGFVGVETLPGRGSKFTIKLPLTLAIIQALLVQVGLETYAIPLSSIDETTHLNRENIKQIQGQEVMLLRGNVLPLIRLDKFLGAPDSNKNSDDYYVVVVRKGNRQAGLIVDSLIGQQDIVIKTLGKLLNGIPGFSGATILGNGHVALILDIGSLI